MSIQQIRLRVLPALLPLDGRSVELQTTDTYVQWRFVADLSGEYEWTDLIAISEITGPAGATTEFRVDGDYIQYRSVGAIDWTNLIATTDITGPTGPIGPVSTVPGITWQGSYNGATAYVVNDGVKFNGSSFRNILAGTGVSPSAASPPVDNASWVVVAAKGSDGIVASVVAGAGISVDSTNPAAPVVSSTLYGAPQGRLTLTSGTPVMTTSVAAATTVYYTPYGGAQVPLNDGAKFVPTSFAELSQATTDTTKSPAAVANNSNYDLFVWNDSGTIRCTRGPAWTNDTTRSAGTALAFVGGVPLNNAAITNGPAAQRGTYVGTIRSNGSAAIDYIFGSIGAGGVAANFGVWNAYNRVPVGTMVMDNTNSWSYAVNATWRAANNSASARASMVRGLDEDAVEASYYGIARVTTGGTAIAGIGVNTTSAYSGSTQGTINTTDFLAMPARYTGPVGIGYRFVSAIEYNDTTNTSTWRGLITSLPYQSGLHVALRA